MDLTKAKLEYYTPNYFGYILDDNGVFADFYKDGERNVVNCFKRFIDCEYLDVPPSDAELKAMFDLLNATPKLEEEEEYEDHLPVDLYFENGVKPENFY